MAAVHGSITDRGGEVIGIAPAAPHQARRLMSESVPYRLFMDSEQALNTRIGLGKQSLVQFLFDLRAWWRYIRAFASGHRQRRITGHYSNLPAVCVVDGAGEVVYAYRGTGLGDYPPLQEILDQLDGVIAGDR
ncbi:MAG: hypothetical protein ABFR95_05340 [Actinomycetota bacterium]